MYAAILWPVVHCFYYDRSTDDLHQRPGSNPAMLEEHGGPLKTEMGQQMQSLKAERTL